MHIYIDNYRQEVIIYKRYLEGTMYITLLHVLYEVPGHNKSRIPANKYSTNRLGIHNMVTSIIFYINSEVIYRGVNHLQHTCI